MFLGAVLEEVLEEGGAIIAIPTPRASHTPYDPNDTRAGTLYPRNPTQPRAVPIAYARSLPAYVRTHTTPHCVLVPSLSPRARARTHLRNPACPPGGWVAGGRAKVSE
jgi:hypothetical protein